MPIKEFKSGNHSITTTETSSFKDESGKTTTISESWSSNENQREVEERKRSFSEYWGIGRYFTIICLIIFFIAPVYNHLLNNWQWEHTEYTTYKGTTHHEFSIDKNPQQYVDLGNRMLSGFTDTLDKISNVSNTSNTVIEKIGESFSWHKQLVADAKEQLKGILDWFKGLFTGD